jgi:hypothetical protein
VLALGYGRKRRLQKKRRSANCAEDTLTEIRLKWLKKKKRRSEVRECESLDEKTEENRSTRKRDHGQLSKRKNPPIDALEHLVERRKDRLVKPEKHVGQVDLGF